MSFAIRTREFWMLCFFHFQLHVTVISSEVHLSLLMSHVFDGGSFYIYKLGSSKIFATIWLHLGSRWRFSVLDGWVSERLEVFVMQHRSGCSEPLRLGLKVVSADHGGRPIQCLKSMVVTFSEAISSALAHVIHVLALFQGVIYYDRTLILVSIMVAYCVMWALQLEFLD